jgi:hypothetical protein
MMHEREKFTVLVATYATAAAQNAGPGGTVKFINSEEPMALMAVEQERLKERRLNIIVRGVEDSARFDYGFKFNRLTTKF